MLGTGAGGSSRSSSEGHTAAEGTTLALCWAGITSPCCSCGPGPCQPAVGTGLSWLTHPGSACPGQLSWAPPLGWWGRGSRDSKGGCSSSPPWPLGGRMSRREETSHSVTDCVPAVAGCASLGAEQGSVPAVSLWCWGAAGIPLSTSFPVSSAEGWAGGQEQQRGGEPGAAAGKLTCEV